MLRWEGSEVHLKSSRTAQVIIFHPWSISLLIKFCCSFPACIVEVIEFWTLLKCQCDNGVNIQSKGNVGNKAFALMNFPLREILQILFAIIFNPLKLSVKFFDITTIYFERLQKTVNKAFSTTRRFYFFWRRWKIKKSAREEEKKVKYLCDVIHPLSI